MAQQGILLIMSEPALEPLTQGLPAAMLPLLDEPLAGLALHLMRRHGVKHVTVVGEKEHVPDVLGDGSLYGLSVDYASKWPGNISEPLFVLRGDVLTDVNLSALEQHRMDAGADTSLCMGAAAVSAEAAARLKPGMRQEEILMALAENAVAAELPGYWCAVNDPESYRRAQLDLLEGRVGMPVSGKRQGKAILAEGGRLLQDVKITGRCFVGRYTQVGAGTVLGTGTVIGRGVQIGRRAYLENACLMENACVDDDTILRNVMVIPRPGNQSLQHLLPFSARES